MTPFAGEGANLAMLDAYELAQFILQNPSDLDAAVKAFEEGLFERTKEAAQNTKDNLDKMFSTNAPMGMVEFFKSLGPPEVSNSTN
jgi:2-polyprenyl-6-methoxyphenol hydroxylase-like FAD-dependent oxidoreductase